MTFNAPFTPLAPELDHIVARLCDSTALKDMAHSPGSVPLPSLAELEDIVARIKALLFSGYFESGEVESASLRHRAAAILDMVFIKLGRQIFRALWLGKKDEAPDALVLERLSNRKALLFIESLPHIRALLAADIRAAYEGDPAATSLGEIILCYPTMQAMLHHRIAHELLLLDVPLIPRILSESSHRLTGIDIHPGARIGEGFFIDHGTGVVIGETCVIGEKCRIYQGVTLGSLSFPRTDSGELVRGARRHPHLGDGVTVYAGASILGCIHIGSGSVIGANVWVTKDVPANTKLSSANSGRK